MTVHHETIAKIRQMPESLVQEVNNFVDFLLMRHNGERWQLWTQFTESLEIADSDFSSYLRNLEDYEERLASGEISMSDRPIWYNIG